MYRNLICRALLASVLLATISPIVAAAGKPSMSRQTFTAMLFDFLAADPMECPAVVAELDAGDQAKCAEVALEWRRLKKKTRSFTRNHLSDDTFEIIPWAFEKGYRSRYVMTSDGPLRLVFDAENDWLAVLPSHPCFESAKMEALKLHTSGCGGVSLPEITQRVRPDYPESARIEKSNGFVVLEAIVLADGSVGGVCVLHESPLGLGFAQAASEAVSRYRFEPAQKSGLPVNSTFGMTLNFEIH